MLLIILALAILTAGLSLIAAGVVVVLKSNNKLAGWVVLAVGIVFLLVPVLILIGNIFTRSISG